MEAGRRDRRIVVYKRSQAAIDQYGHPTPRAAAWEPLATLWAEIKESSARERLSSAQTLAARAATIRILYRDDITEEMVIEYKGLRWNIKSITELGRKEALEMLCEVVKVNT